MKKSKNILLGQLSSNGDCLYATTLARQIKQDYPYCHLTWAISTLCRNILDGNPYVDDIWEISLNSKEPQEVEIAWSEFELEARKKQKLGIFDLIFLTQISPGNLHNFDGTVRSSIFRGYPNQISVPISPIIRLSITEVDNVQCFVDRHDLLEKESVILFECSPESGQSFIDFEFALSLSKSLVSRYTDIAIILSSNITFPYLHERIIDGSLLTLRENAELSKYCSLLVGGSSGVSWITTSDWAKRLNMIQLLRSDSLCFASFVYDHEYWGLPIENIIEISDCSPSKVESCIDVILRQDFSKARNLFHEKIPLNFNAYKYSLSSLLRERQFLKVVKLLRCTIERHGFHWNLVSIPILTFLQRTLDFLARSKKI